MSKRRYFLPFELDAFANCAAIGNACGLPVERVSHGHLCMWQFVWRTKRDVVTAGQLAGFFFGINPAAALVDFGVLEPVEGGFRVKGAAEWLRVVTAQSAAGKAHASNLQKGRQDLSGSPPASAPKSAEAGDKPSGSPPALPATSDQRPATTTNTAGGSGKGQGAKKPPTDARHAPLVAELVEIFKENTGARYPFGPRDAAHVTELLALEPEPERISTVWRTALRHAGFPTVRTLSQLVSHFPHFVGSGPPVTSKGPIDAATQVHTHTGIVENF